MRASRSPALRPNTSATKFRYCMPVRFSYRSGLSGMYAVTRLQAMGSALTEWPSIRISPSVKSSTPTTARIVVDLPAPLWPMKPNMSPLITLSDTPSTAFFSDP